MLINPRYEIWVKLGKPDPFPCWITKMMRDAYKTGHHSVTSLENKYYREAQLRIVDQDGFTEYLRSCLNMATAQT